MEHDEYTFLCGYQKIRRYGSTSDLNSPGLTSTINRYSRIIVHRVEPSDTLQSLELKYNSSMCEIKRLNRLWSNSSLHCKTHINIPIFASTADDSPESSAAGGSQIPSPPTSQAATNGLEYQANGVSIRRCGTQRACSLRKVDEISAAVDPSGSGGESLDQFFKRIDRNVKRSQKVVKKLSKRSATLREVDDL